MLKTFFPMMTLLSLIFLSSCHKKPDDPPKEDFQKMADEFVSAWNRHDTQGLIALWAVDGNLITPWSHEFNGIDEIRHHFEQEHTNSMKNAQISLKVQHVRLIDPETAFIDADMTLTGMVFGGEKAVPLHDHAIFLMVKRNGKWQILIARPY